MKANESLKNVRLGIFVIIATVFLIGALYLVGSKENLFGNTFAISAEFYDVNGLMPGHNVRLSGIDVGTVRSIEITSDSTVRVTMIIEENVRQHIRKNAVVSIGTDGLMGNKLININAGDGYADPVEEGDVLAARREVNTDEMIRTLNKTNDNLEVITENLRNITDRINSENTLWSLLMDTAMAQNVKASVVNIRVASDQSAILTGNLAAISNDIRNGKGSIGALITDTTLSHDIKQIIVKFNMINDTAAQITGDISSIVADIKNGKGTIGVLLNDTNTVHQLNASLSGIQKGSVLLNEDLTAVRESWPFKRYFRKQKRMKTK